MVNTIFVSNGMPRSGSTYQFQLICSLFYQINSSHGSKLVAPADIMSEAKVPYTGDGYIHDSSELELAIDKLFDYDFGFPAYICIKTHCPLSERLSLLIANETIFASCTFRDPIDMAVSVFNVSQDEIRRGVSRFGRYNSIEEVLAGVKYNIYSSLPWLLNEKVLPVYFEYLTTDPHSVVLAITKKIGLHADVDSIINWFEFDKTRRIGEFSAYKSSIANDDLSSLTDFFKEYYDQFPSLIDFSKNAIRGLK